MRSLNSAASTAMKIAIATARAVTAATRTISISTESFSPVTRKHPKAKTLKFEKKRSDYFRSFFTVAILSK